MLESPGKLEVCQRREVAETVFQGGLPYIPTPSFGEVAVTADTDQTMRDPAVFEVGQRFVLKSAVRVYKSPFANRTLRGCDIKAIGDGHALQDKPMMIEGKVRVLEKSTQRVKVSGHACAEAEGTVHYVKGWIETDGVT